MMRGGKVVIGRRLIHYNLGIWRFVFCLGVCLFASSADFARLNGTPQNRAAHMSKEAKEKETTLRGCLGGRHSGTFYYLVADDGGYFYILSGNTSLLTNSLGKEISLRGKEDDSMPPPRFEVTSFRQGFDAPSPTLKPSFKDSTWHTERNRKYGIEFSYPEDLKSSPVLESGRLEGNFVADQSVVPIAQLTIPAGVYPDTNFRGGSYAIFVNPKIGNDPSCRQFGFSDPRFASSYAARGIHYTETKRDSAAAGTSYSGYSFHTFQNGLCYELAFDFGEVNPGSIQVNAMFARVSPEQKNRVILALKTRGHVVGYRVTASTTPPLAPIQTQGFRVPLKARWLIHTAAPRSDRPWWRVEREYSKRQAPPNTARLQRRHRSPGRS
jgi:hypothetical protein